MTKRPRYLLGLAAVFAWQDPMAKGFLPLSSSRVQSRNSHKQLDFLDRRLTHPSTCIRTATNTGDDPEAQNDNGFSVNTINADMFGKSAATGDLKLLGDMSLSQLLEVLDKRNIRYSPGATRSDLELLFLQGTQQTSPVTSQLSLQELIDELDRRDIRYAPTASRKELEEILTALQNERPQGGRRNAPVIDIRQTKDAAYSNGSSDPLSTIIEELDKRNIRYPPTASRMQLEALLDRARAVKVQEQGSDHRHELITTAFDETTAEDATRVSLQRTARVNKKKSDQRSSRPSMNESEVIDVKVTETPSKPAPPSRRMPLDLLLTKLDQLDIRYSPTASRVELEGLLQQTLGKRALHEQRRQRRRRQRETIERNDKSLKSIVKKSTRVATKSVQKLPRKVSRIVTSPQVTSRLSGVADRAVRQAKRVSRRASDFWHVDENGIRDVHFKYVSVDRPIDVRAVRMDEVDVRRTSSRRARPQPPRPPRTSEPRQPPPRTRKSQASVRRSGSIWQTDRVQKQRCRKRPVSRELVENSLGSSSFLLPPSSHDTALFPNLTNATSPSTSNVETVPETSTFRDRRRRARDTSRTASEQKQLYSPYVYDEDGEIEGPFDRIGEFLTNSADRLLWGLEDENIDTQRQHRRQGDMGYREAKQRVNGGPRSQGESEKREQKPRYWKDRLAEHVDYALGIHEDGEYYNSWEKQLDAEQERREREGVQFWERSDPLPRKRRTPAKGGAKYSRPFWEEDGSIIAFILGRTKTGDQLGLDRIMGRTKGDDRMVTTFFNSALRSVLLISTYVCRWASVRGAIPQPIVVIGAASAFLSARPRFRLRALFIALVAFRTVGELIHGYAYGDADGWEDDDDEGDDPSNHISKSLQPDGAS